MFSRLMQAITKIELQISYIILIFVINRYPITQKFSDVENYLIGRNQTQYAISFHLIIYRNETNCIRHQGFVKRMISTIYCKLII